MIKINENINIAKNLGEETIELFPPPTTPKARIETKPKRKTYSQNWQIYNLFQSKEKLITFRLLNDAVDFMNLQNKQKMGRPCLKEGDIIKCLVIKEYLNLSSRRSVSDFWFLRSMGYITHPPHFNSILKYLKKESTTKTLKQLLRLTVEPLKEVESFAAIDSSGWSSYDRKRWSQTRGNFKEHKYYAKLHIVCGVRTNCVISCDVSEGNRADSPFFIPLLKETMKTIPIKEISADAAYLSKENCRASYKEQIQPFIYPKKNIKLPRKRGPPSGWGGMLLLWKKDRERFLRHYHRRSNVETSFAQLKVKFGSYLRCKNFTAQKNELMCKVISHNLATLGKAILEFDLDTKF